MGKLIRNGIEYGGGNGTDIFEVTQAQYDALKLAGNLVRDSLYVITDADNNNTTASDIEYSSGVSVKQAIDSDKSNINTISGKITTSNIDNFVVAEGLSFANGTTTEQCISNIITTYGKKTICFGYVLTGVGWFSGMLTFHSDTQGGGFLVAMGNGKFWSITYVNGTVSIFEK